MCGRKFTIKTVCMAAKQMVRHPCLPPWLEFTHFRLCLQVTRVQAIHEKSLIYRDIKPDNFLIGVAGSKTANTIHIIGKFCFSCPTWYDGVSRCYWCVD